MKTATINIYKFSELPEETQEKIILSWRDNDDYFWSSENKDTLDAFEEIFPVKIKKWEYDYHNFIDFDFTETKEIENLTEQRLATYLWNNYKKKLFKGKYYSNTGYYDDKKQYHYKKRYSKIILEHSCVLTGYCIDDDILEPIYKFLDKPTNINFYDLMNDCLQSWVYACNKDYEYWLSEESIKEDILNNDYDFTEDGKIY